MSKKTNSSSYHFENYIQIQKLNIALKIRFNISELAPRTEKSRQSIRSKKWDIRIYCQAKIFTVFTHRESKGINA